MKCSTDKMSKLFSISMLVCSASVLLYTFSPFSTYRPKLRAAPPPLEYKVTEEQLEELHRRGAIHLPKVLNEEWIRFVSDMVEDRVSHPYIGALLPRLFGLYSYQQFNSWMTTPSWVDWLSAGPGISIARAVFPHWGSIRLLMENLFYKPMAKFPALLAPLHIDCETGGAGCPHFDIFRLWITLDPVPAWNGVVFQENTHNNTEAGQEYSKLTCPTTNNHSRYFTFPLEAGDGLVWFGDTVHFAYGGDRRVVSMALIDGERSVLDEARKPHLTWDWYNHGVQHGDKIQGPYFPMIYPSLLEEETKARDQKQVKYLSGSLWKILPFLRDVIYNFGGTKKSRCQYDPSNIQN